MRIALDGILTCAIFLPHSSTSDFNMTYVLIRAQIWTILHGKQEHTYSVILKQTLLPQDNEGLFDWCNWAFINVEGNSGVLPDIVLSDAVLFQHNLVLNRHNDHFQVL